MSVMRLGYVHTRVTDMGDALSHYCHTLACRRWPSNRARCVLKAWDEYDHHSVVLEEGGVGLVKLGYKVERPEDIETYEKRAQAFGVITERMSKGENLASVTVCGSCCPQTTFWSSTTKPSRPAPLPVCSTPRPGRATWSGLGYRAWTMR